jgi:hypothetical protein
MKKTHPITQVSLYKQTLFIALASLFLLLFHLSLVRPKSLKRFISLSIEPHHLNYELLYNNDNDRNETVREKNLS